MNWLRNSISFLLIFLIICGCTPTSYIQQQHPKTNIQLNFETKAALPVGKGKTAGQAPTLTLAELHHKYPRDFVFSGSNKKHEVALTFDDVPDVRFTPQILDILKQYGVKATFFAIGNRVSAHPELVLRIVREGHEIGNHSFTHPNLPKVDNTRFHEEIQRTDKVLSSIINAHSKLFRPPYGNITEPQILWLASHKYKIINWNVDSLDWKGLSAQQVMENVLGHIHNGSIILQHGGGGDKEDLSGTIKALPVIIRHLKSKGMKLVTISQLMDMPKKK
jgi:peptidoglycan-N-acetylglucosamine deacetylase